MSVSEHKNDDILMWTSVFTAALESAMDKMDIFRIARLAHDEIAQVSPSSYWDDAEDRVNSDAKFARKDLMRALVYATLFSATLDMKRAAMSLTSRLLYLAPEQARDVHRSLIKSINAFKREYAKTIKKKKFGRLADLRFIHTETILEELREHLPTD